VVSVDGKLDPRLAGWNVNGFCRDDETGRRVRQSDSTIAADEPDSHVG
jgi:hypothetical protein